MALVTKTPDQTRQRGHTVSALPSLVPCYYIICLGRDLLNQHFLPTLFFLQPPPFSTSRRLYVLLFWGVLRSFASPPPSLILPLASRLWTLVLRMMRRMTRRSRWGVGSCSWCCWSIFGVAPTLVFSNPPPLSLRTFPDSLYPPLSSLLPSPFSLSFSIPLLSSSLFPSSSSFPSPPLLFALHRFLPPVPRALVSPCYHVVGQTLGLAPEAAGYLQAHTLTTNFKMRFRVRNGSASSSVLFSSGVADTRALLFSLFPLRSRSRSRRRSCLAVVLSSPRPFPFLLRLRPHHRRSGSRPRPVSVLVPAPAPSPFVLSHPSGLVVS